MTEAVVAALFRDAPTAALLLDEQGRVVHANPSAVRLLGANARVLEGLPLWSLWTATSPEDSSLFDELRTSRRTRITYERRPCTRENGGHWWMNASVVRATDSAPARFLAFLEDANPRGSEESARQLLSERSARAEAEAARRRIAFLAEASVALSSSLETSTTLERLAELAVPILGDLCIVELLEPDGSLRRVAEAALDPDTEARLQELPEVLPRKGAQHRDAWIHEVVRHRRTRLVASIDGSPLTATDISPELAKLEGMLQSLLIVPLYTAGRTQGTILFGATQKERRYSESDVAMAEEFARRAALAIENAQLYQDAREASRLKDDFLAIVSHELRTPLMPILGWSQLLRDGGQDAKTVTSGLETIERNARAQARLVDDLLDVSRIISGKLRLETRLMPLAPTVEDAVEALRPAARAKSIRLEFDLDEAPRVVGDATRLLQVVWNLVSNAIKFTPPGGRVDVELHATEERALLHVRDTGEGIPADFLPFVFERFRQAEAAATRKHGGLGLGLSIVRHVVELHGGTVSASSTGRGEGAEFIVSLPIASTEQGSLETGPREQEVRLDSAMSSPPNRLDDVRLLIVEDQPDTLALLTRMLSELGATVTGAGTAAEAMRLLLASPPDVLVSDIGLPLEDGIAFIKKVRALPPGAGGRVPAIALTAFARTEDRVRALQAGFQSHVPKPVEPAELAAVVASLATKPSPRRSKAKPKARPAPKPAKTARPKRTR